MASPTSARPCVTVSLLFGASAEEVRTGFTTVWMHGDHNSSTSRELSEAIRRASDLDDADVMVDFSDVKSMNIHAVEVILAATASLRERSLVLRSRHPSPYTRRFVELHGFAWLFAKEVR